MPVLKSTESNKGLCPKTFFELENCKPTFARRLNFCKIQTKKKYLAKNINSVDDSFVCTKLNLAENPSTSACLVDEFRGLIGA